MFYLLLTAIALILWLLNKKNGMAVVFVIYCFLFIITGCINEEKYSYLLEPVDWFILILLFSLSVYSVFTKTYYAFNFAWPDKLLFFYFVFVIGVPLLANYSELSSRDFSVFAFLIPVRLWIIYRVMSIIIFTGTYRIERMQNIIFYLNIIIIIGMISAVISIIRYFPVPGVTDLIEETWPIITNLKTVPQSEWGRLWGTMSGTNGAGSFFSFLSVFSLYCYESTKKRYYFIFLFLFLLCLVLSLSFSSIIAFVAGFFLFYRGRVFARRIIVPVFVIMIALFTISNVELFTIIAEKRIESNFSREQSESILPRNFQERLGYWKDQADVLVSEDKIFFGFGPGGVRNSSRVVEEDFHGNPESMYFQILNDTGLFGLFAFIILFYFIYRNILFIEHFYKNEALFFKTIIVMFLVNCVANQTLYYGGNTEIFAIILALTHYYKRKVIMEMGSGKQTACNVAKNAAGDLLGDIKNY